MQNSPVGFSQLRDVTIMFTSQLSYVMVMATSQFTNVVVVVVLIVILVLCASVVRQKVSTELLMSSTDVWTLPPPNQQYGIPHSFYRGGLISLIQHGLLFPLWAISLGTTVFSEASLPAWA
jgi:hypothetical protein